MFRVVGGEIVEQEEVDALQLSHLFVVSGVGACSFGPFEQLVGAFGVNRVTAAYGGVS